MVFASRLTTTTATATRCLSVPHPPRAATSSTTTTLLDVASNHPTGVAKVILKKGKSQLFRDGNPMVYSGAVDRIIGRPPPSTGDPVLVADGTQKPIGWGFYNSTSMFCVRLMQLQDEVSRDPSCALNVDRLLETRICAAINLRRNLGLPSANTNSYRLVNSEGDRLSGLIIDIFGDVAVIASSAAWVEKYKSQIKSCVGRFTEINSISWRPSIEILKEEGLDVSDLGQSLPSASAEMVKVVENGVSYLISLEGQKTGFYADQRENRQFISTISGDRKVLDMCCYTGGFALNAAHGHALTVTGTCQFLLLSFTCIVNFKGHHLVSATSPLTCIYLILWGWLLQSQGVDTSLPALELANKNIVLNNLDPGRISFLRQDATDFMKHALSRNELWDIVIMDPPKLAPRRKVLQSASGMYRNLNSLAMRLTKKGGFLMTCSCSGAMTQSGTFFQILQGAASMAGRKITVVRQAGAACDHPVDPAYPEGAYLSNVLLRVL